MRMEDLKIEIYADGADLAGMEEMYQKNYIKGFTTNPTLMKKAGVTDYLRFAREVVERIPDRPISFEVFSDDFREMEREARVLSEFGDNVYVKIPVTNTKGVSSAPLIGTLCSEGINLNITAVFTIAQVKGVLHALEKGRGNSIVSIFAGRIADAGEDPEIVMKKATALCHEQESVKSLWASCREVFNIVQADRCGVDIITVTNDILKKCHNIGKDLEQFSLETVNMFYNDGVRLGFSIDRQGV